MVCAQLAPELEFEVKINRLPVQILPNEATPFRNYYFAYYRTDYGLPYFPQLGGMRYPKPLGNSDTLLFEFSLWPLNTHLWLPSLFKRRLIELAKANIVDTVHLPHIILNLIPVSNLDEAKSINHGVFIIKDRKSLSIKNPNRFLSKEAKEVQQFIDENGGARDSTVFKVLSRHPEWKNMLIVMDWTGSMYHNGSLAVLWHLLNQKQSGIKYYAFFNDGDEKTDEKKKLGKTGGIYGAKANDIREVIRLMRFVQQNGYGGGSEENDIEAIIKAIDMFPDFDEVVLIADNSSCIRDFRLVEQIKKPIRIITCGTHLYAYLQTDSGLVAEVTRVGVNPQYVNLAHLTGGSIHTIEEDIENLSRKIGGTLSINHTLYRLESNGVSVKKTPIGYYKLIKEDSAQKPKKLFLQNHFDCNEYY